MRHPFVWLSHDGQRRLFLPLVVVTLIVWGALMVMDAPLRTEAAPNGIVSFELAGTPERAQAMLASWGERGRLYAALIQGLDYLFLCLWPASVALGCVLVARNLSGGLASLGVWLAWGQVAGGLLDAIEDYALIQILLGKTEALWPALARAAAIPKFVVLALGLFYALLGALVLLARKRSA